MVFNLIFPNANYWWNYILMCHITSPSTIAPSVLDSKPLRAFSPVMAGVRSHLLDIVF